MAITYEPIATTTLNATQTTVTLSSIPNTYTDLVIVCSPLGSAGNYDFRFRFNSDSGSNYSWGAFMFNADNSSNPYGTQGTNASAIITQTNISTGTDAFPIIINVHNYANTSVYKSTISRVARGNYATSQVVGMWRSTAAINSVSFSLIGGGSADLVANSTFTVYGIKAA